MHDGDKAQARLVAQLLDECHLYGIGLSESVANLLVRHLLLVIKKNKVLNLTRILDPVNAVTLHILDSLLFSDVIQRGCGPSDTLLDIGTGAGFPGIPIASTTGLEALLIDSVGKKIRAVEEFIDTLGLSSQIRCQSVRAEDLARVTPHSFAFVTARAVAGTNVLVEYAAPLLTMHGRLVISKAYIKDDELTNALYASQLCGMELVSRETFDLPRQLGHREVLSFKKVRKARIKLPRETGAAKRKPFEKGHMAKGDHGIDLH